MHFARQATYKKKAEDKVACFFPAWRLVCALVLNLILYSMQPGQAALLHGYLQNDDPSESSACVARQANPATGAEPVAADAFPVVFQGSWQCVTVVLDSSVDIVPVGKQISSRLDFVRQDDGKLKAKWQQDGWVQAQSSVTAFNSHQVMMDRTDYFYADAAGTAWAARSRDQFNVVGPNKIEARSEVDQYAAGQYLGRYRTQSILYRLNDNGEIAFGASKP